MTCAHKDLLHTFSRVPGALQISPGQEERKAQEAWGKGLFEELVVLFLSYRS